MRVRLTERELDVMAVLWDIGPSTAAEVRERLADELAYNTVLTVLRILEDKGYVRHTEEGRAHRYHPLVDRAAAGASVLGRVVDKLFGGSAELLLTHLVRDPKLDAGQISRKRQLLDRRLRGEDP